MTTEPDEQMEQDEQTEKDEQTKVLIGRGVTLARFSHHLPWDWGDILLELVGPPPEPGTRQRGVTKKVDDFRFDVYEEHFRSDGKEGLDKEAIPSIQMLLKFRSIAYWFPPESRGGLSRSGAELLLRHVPTEEQRDEILNELDDKGRDYTIMNIRRILKERGFLFGGDSSSPFDVCVKRIKVADKGLETIERMGEHLEDEEFQEVLDMLRAHKVHTDDLIERMDEEPAEEPVKINEPAKALRSRRAA